MPGMHASDAMKPMVDAPKPVAPAAAAH